MACATGACAAAAAPRKIAANRAAVWALSHWPRQRPAASSMGTSLDRTGSTAGPPALVSSVLMAAAAAAVAVLTRAPSAGTAADERFGHSQSRRERPAARIGRPGEARVSVFDIPWCGWKDIF